MKALGLFLFGLMLATPARADIAARYEAPEGSTPLPFSMTVEVSDEGYVRVGSPMTNGYFLLRDGELYSVSRGIERDQVIRVQDMVVLQEELSRRLGMDRLTPADDAEIPDFSLVAIGAETVRGRNGTAYGFAAEDESVPGRTMLVIANDTALAPLGRGVARAQAALGAAPGQLAMMLGRLSADMANLLADGAPLKMGPAELTDVSLADIDDARFELPAPPTPLGELRRATEPFPEPPTLTATSPAQ